MKRSLNPALLVVFAIAVSGCKSVRELARSAAQGFDHGWSSIRLHPHDTAKIGFLWLNHGQWEGKQIVSKDWVENSVKTQVKTGRDDDYGYGWWITGIESEYAAIGRGGQRIEGRLRDP